MENEKQLTEEEPKAVSPGKAENANEDVDCCSVHEDTAIKDDLFAKEDGLDVKDCSISDLKADSNINDQPLPVMCDGPDTVKNDCFTDCNCQTPFKEQPPRADDEENAYHELQFRKLCANGSALTDEHSILEKACHIPSEKEPIDYEPVVEENLENGICLADLRDQLLSNCDGPDSRKDYITECKGQAQLVEQPPQADNEENACHDLQFRKLCVDGSALTDQNTISETAPYAPSEMEPIYNESVVEEHSENHVCLVDKTHYQKAALLMSEESTGSLDGSSADSSILQRNNSVETGSKAKASFSLNSDGEDWDTKLNEGEQNVENTTLKELFYDQSHSPQSDAVTRFEAEVALTKGIDLKSDQTNKGLEKIHNWVVIPFIGIDCSGEDAVQPHDSHSEGKVEEVQGQKETSLISKTAYPETDSPTEVCGAPQMYRKKAELSAGKISLSLNDVSEINQPEVSGSETDDRSPTPTMDEEPYQHVTCYGPSSSTSSSSSSSFILIKDKMPLKQKHKSAVNSDPNPHHHFHPDIELRTQRLLQSIDEFLSKSRNTDQSSQIKTADMKHSLDQTDKLQETSVGQDCFHPHKSFPPTECLQSFKPNVDKDGHKTTSQTNSSHEMRSFSQRPVMAVKPSKSDEILANCISKDRQIENSVMSNFSRNKRSKTPIDLYTTPASMLLEIKTESLKGNSAGQNAVKQEASELSTKSSWLSNSSNSKSNSDEAKLVLLDPLYQHKGRDISKFNKIPSSSRDQSFLTNSLAANIGQTTKESIEMDQKYCSAASTSAVDYKDDSIINDGLFLGPQSSLTCTIFNTSQNKSDCFLEQLSKRCLQEDLTQASMEQECLIFSEQMKQLLKRSKRGPIHQLDAHDKLNLSCSSPVTVHFSSLEEQEDAVDHFDAPSLVGQKIKVDMSDRKDLADTTEEENTLLPQKLSEETSNPMEYAGVSGVNADCARLYTVMMNDVCAVKKVPSRPKHFRMDRGYPKTEPSNHFDFCDQMKREMDGSFCSNMNSVVKKSYKTKYRFYMLVTSDDAFFEETKVRRVFNKLPMQYSTNYILPLLSIACIPESIKVIC